MEGVRVEQFADLLTVGNGAAAEKFVRELERVFENIKDPNTEATDRRTITLKFSFHPTEDRESVGLNIHASSSLPASKPTSDVVYLRRVDGKVLGTVMHPKEDPRQGVLTLQRREVNDGGQ